MMTTKTRGRCRHGGHAVALVAAFVAAAVVVVPVSVNALFTDTQGTGGNQFSTGACFQSRFSSRQTGAVTSSANGTQTVAISSVDPSKAFLMLNVRSNSNRPVGSTIRGRIASATSLEFVRVTNESPVSSISIRWYVVEYSCGVTVQRGSTSLSSSTVNIAITPVASTAQAFVTWSQTPNSMDQEWGSDDQLLVDLTTTSNLQLRSQALNANMTVWWQVVEFTNAADVNVQRGSTSMTGTTTSATATIPAPVDTDRTFLITAFRSSGAGVDIGARLIRARLMDSTTIAFDRGASGTPDDITEIVWQAVELRDGSRVQHGSEAFAATESQRTPTISAVDTSRSSAFASVIVGTQSGGRTPYTADDVVGVATATITLTSSTQLTLERGNTAAAADIAWFVVEWGGPSWWNGSWGFRKPIAITAAGSSVPSGYSVQLTMDHASLVTAGQSLGNGNDVRVVYWNGASWVELDRILDEGSAWNGGSTTIWFKTQASIPANGRDISYYLYYANPSAGGPPTNRSNVFLLYDGFETGTLGNWTDQTPPVTVPLDWYRGSWSYRKLITIDPSQISGSHTNFPVLISVTDSALSARAQADGDDLLFTASDGVTKLDHEIERYTSASGTFVAWVRMPTLSTSSNTLYLYYGNAGANSQQNRAGVWDADYVGVWHLDENASDEASAATFADSTSNANTGNQSGNARTTGLIAGGQDFDGVNDYISVPSSASLQVTSAITLSGWVRPRTHGSGSDVDPILRKGEGNPNNYQLVGQNAGRAGLLFDEGDGGGLSGATTMATNQWHYVVGTYNGSTRIVYLNGAADASGARSGAIGTDTRPLYIGGRSGATDITDGILDEVRLSRVARSASWIATEYNNQSSPSTFHSVGAQETLPGWYDSQWGYRKKITVDPTRVSGTLSNFPILISVTDANLQARAQADGDDIVFTSSDGTTKLSHEIEKYVSASGQLVAWVRLPTLSSTSNTLYLYYGNPSAANQQDVAGVWDASFAGVWHLANTPTGASNDVRDSTSNARHGTSQGGMGSANQVTGQTDGALDFDGINDKINVGDPNANAWTGITVEAWIRPDAQNLDRVVCRASTPAAVDTNFCLFIDAGALQARLATDGTGGGSATTDTFASGVVTTGAWTHVAFTWDGTEDLLRIYTQGLQRASFAKGGSTIVDSTLQAFIANVNATDDRHFDGIIDEVRLSSARRTTGWLQTEYNNLSSPSTFHTLGPEQGQEASTFGVASDQARSGSYALRLAPHANVERYLTANGIGEANVQMDAWWRLSSIAGMDLSQGVRSSSSTPISQYESNLVGSAGWNIAKEIGGARTVITAAPSGQNPQANTWIRISVVIVGTNIKVLRDGTQLVPTSGWSNAGSEVASGTVAIRGYNIPAGQNAWIDDVVVRLILDPEPTTSFGTEDRL